MARNLNRVQVWTTGYFFMNTNASDTAPTDWSTFWNAGINSTTAPSGWVEIGHTDRDNPLTITREGGESTIITTLQGGVIESRSAVTYYMDFISLQLDEVTMPLFFSGGTSTSSASNAFSLSSIDFSVPKTETIQARGLVAVFVDGKKRDVFYARAANIGANGSITGPSPRQVPLRATVTGVDADNYLFKVWNGLAP